MSYKARIANFWKGKKVIVTGHSGFKGSWLVILLHSLGAKVYGISLEPNTKPNLFEIASINSLCESIFCDIGNYQALKGYVETIAPDIVFHLAAQSLVRQSYKNPMETFTTNIIGSANVLESLLPSKTVKSIVMVTTDKVYENREWVYPYREIDPLGGHDPYSASKAASEIVIASYRESLFCKSGNVAISTARAGNVIGGGDWSEDRLIPDAIKAWTAGSSLLIRNPDAIRPWQHVLEALFGYLILSQKQFEDKEFSGSYNFGPDKAGSWSVRAIAESAKTYFNKDASITYVKNASEPHEANLLFLDTSKSMHRLHVRPTWTLNEAIRRTVTWYLDLDRGGGNDALSLCMRDINDFWKKNEENNTLPTL